ncbi:Protein N-acetyltransferase, RimJ/RimL family [Rathayibacter oskolensis]|uniref:Protein N-acetyltransferase, RimJ/RimL family n=1 Tax=Rathayibacter oskolensis TaxID=1891671 RepID=A0A1X7PFS1_9MICO|nr:GNAT family N-acetyltransferase [Rathayibacter oskolensis]SMH49734.1 Protein N-acetyltransferase, RimJ/RimL family [Rathayibacter oskolensis]
MTGPEPGSDHRTVSIDQQSETLRLLPWPQVDAAALRSISAQSQPGLGNEDEVRLLHDRYLRGWAEGTEFFYAIELDGHCVGSIGYWYGHSRGVLAYETTWSLDPEARARGVAARAVRLLLEEAAEFPVPRFVHAFVRADDQDDSALCVEVGFDRVDVVEQGEPPSLYCDWAFDLAEVA